MSDSIKAGGGQSPGDPPPTNPFEKFDPRLLCDALTGACKRVADSNRKTEPADVDLIKSCLPYVADTIALLFINREGGGQSPGDPPPTKP